jgi:hypothetical protein
MAHAEVLPYFEACALFVVPSRAEPFGAFLVERDDEAEMAAKIRWEDRVKDYLAIYEDAN